MRYTRALLALSLISIPQLAQARPGLRSDAEVVGILASPSATLKRLKTRLPKIMNPMQANMMLMQLDQMATMANLKKPIYMTSSAKAGAEGEVELVLYIPASKAQERQLRQMLSQSQGPDKPELLRDGDYLLISDAKGALKKPRKLKLPAAELAQAKGFDLAAITLQLAALRKGAAASGMQEPSRIRLLERSITDKPSVTGLRFVKGGLQIAGYASLRPHSPLAQCLMEGKLSSSTQLRGLPKAVDGGLALAVGPGCIDAIFEATPKEDRPEMTPLLTSLRASVRERPEVVLGYTGGKEIFYAIAPGSDPKLMKKELSKNEDYKGSKGGIIQVGDTFILPSRKQTLVSSQRAALKSTLAKAARGKTAPFLKRHGYKAARATLPRKLSGEFVVYASVMAKRLGPQAKAVANLPPVVFGLTHTSEQSQIVGFVPDELLSFLSMFAMR